MKQQKKKIISVKEKHILLIITSQENTPLREYSVILIKI